MKKALITKLAVVIPVAGIEWQANIYSSSLMESPANLLDCMNECAYVQIGICQFFVYDNGVCYLGRGDITNGSVAQYNSQANVYTLKGLGKKH